MNDEIKRANPSFTDHFLATLAEQLGAAAKASVVFGEPVERDGITVIPVAKALWGFGGGGGRREHEAGTGGGGGVRVTPVGFIEMRNGEARFQRINSPSPVVYAIGGLTAFIFLKILRRR